MSRGEIWRAIIKEGKAQGERWRSIIKKDKEQGERWRPIIKEDKEQGREMEGHHKGRQGAGERDGGPS